MDEVLKQRVNSTNFVAQSSNGTNPPVEVSHDAGDISDNSVFKVDDVTVIGIDVDAISPIKNTAGGYYVELNRAESEQWV